MAFEYRVRTVAIIERCAPNGRWEPVPGHYDTEDDAYIELAAQQQRRLALTKEGLP